MSNDKLFGLAGSLALFASAPLCAAADLRGQTPGTSNTVGSGATAPNKEWWRGYMAAPHVRLPDGRRLTLFCQGKGTPVVVLDIGLGGGAWGWSTVQGEMARKTRVCSYDRAGYSDSDPAKTPRSFDALEADLTALLTAAKVRGPYVLVGQSLGGPIVGLVAQRHPQKVAGLVLIDPAVGNQVARLAAISPEADQRTSRIAAAARCVRAADEGTLLPGSEIEKSCVAPDRSGFAPPAFAAATYRKWQRGSNLRAKLAETEGTDFATLRWPNEARTETRTLVLTAPDDAPAIPKARELWELWNTMHDEIAAASVDGLNCVVPRSTHSMMSSRPDAVIHAVSVMVDAVRGNQPLDKQCRF